MIEINRKKVNGKNNDLLVINSLKADDEGYDPELIHLDKLSVDNINGNDILILDFAFNWSCNDEIKFNLKDYKIEFTTDLTYEVSAHDILNIKKINKNNIEFSKNSTNNYKINDVNFFEDQDFKPHYLKIYNKNNELITDDNIISEITDLIISNQSELLSIVLDDDKISKPYISLNYFGNGYWSNDY